MFFDVGNVFNKSHGTPLSDRCIPVQTDSTSGSENLVMPSQRSALVPTSKHIKTMAAR